MVADALRSLNAACAHALGYETLWAEDSVFGAGLYLHDAGAVRTSPNGTSNCHLLGADWERLRVNGEVREYFVRLCPNFAGRYDDGSRLLEDEVKRIGLSDRYTLALFEIVNGLPWGPDVTLDEVFLMAYATPEQRGRAFLGVMKNATR